MTGDGSRRSGRAVRRRCRSTALGEVVSCFVLPAVLFGLVGAPVSAANVVGTVAMVLLLVQGALYWWVKAAMLERRRDHAAWMRAFERLRTFDIVMLVVAGALIGWSAVAVGPALAWVGLGFWVLAVLEFVNYFHWQLMYDNRSDLTWLVRRGLKRPALARDLERHARRQRQANA